MLRKNQRSLKISRFVMICLLQLRLIFCCSCVLPVCFSWGLLFAALASCTAHIHERERERERERELKKEMKRKKQKVRWVLLLSVVPKRVDVISKCVVGGNLRYVESIMCGGKKISNGQWYCYSWCTYFLLFERLKNN